MNKLSLIIILSILALLHCLKPSSATCNPDDLSGLLGFKSGIISDPSGLLSTWKSGTDCCTWQGISCQDNRVTTITIYGTYSRNGFLTGKISPSISKLKFLNGIYLENLLKISGPLPDSMFGMPELQYIYMSNNSLSGPIPAAIRNLTKLYALGLSQNKLTGMIPSSISELTQLSQLRLDGNQFTGTIPSSLKKLKSLTLLNLSKNKLTGPIPDFFTPLAELRILNLTGNQLSGKIPATISSLSTNLRYLELGQNQLSGQIPDYLGKFKALDTLDLSKNQFTGTVPKSFANLTKIFNLDLSYNMLTDPFPELYVKGIESLDLSYNKFNLGKIPKWVAASPIIYSLKLAKCGIKMKLDEFNPTETYFYDFIDLSENEITGSPVKLLNRTDYLVGFWAAGNKLKFDFETLKIGSRMKYLDLSRNLVYGKVPKNVTRLEKLNASHNHLCGPLPTTSFGADAFVGNDCLCGSPLAPCK